MSELTHPLSTLRQWLPQTSWQVPLDTDEIDVRSCLRATLVGGSDGPDNPSPTVTLKAPASSSSEGISPCTECSLSVPALNSAAGAPGGGDGEAMLAWKGVGSCAWHGE
jgi:hypothetical protein